MHVTENDREREIRALALGDEITDFLIKRDAPIGMGSLFQAPTSFYAQGYPDNPAGWQDFDDRVLLPLWETDGLIFAVDVKNAVPEYIGFYREEPAAYDRHGHSVFGVLFHMLALHVWEYGGEEEELEEALTLARRLQFPDYQMLAAMLSDPDADNARVEAYLARLE